MGYELPKAVRERVLRRQGALHAHRRIEAARSALVVVDMQNYFVAQGFPAEVPAARGIVAQINRLARALRAAGGRVAWVQTTSRGALEKWRNHHEYMLTPERRAARLAGLAEGSEGFRLFPGLEALEEDLYARKIHYSAFIPGGGDLDEQLRGRGVETLLIAGTATNVCCESTARDAMMLDYRVVLLSDANAAATQGEHAASIDTFAMFFGDVMSVEEACARLVPAGVAAPA